MAHWRGGDVARSPAATSIDEQPSAEDTVIQAGLDIPVVSARPSRSAGAADDLTATRPQAFCKGTGAKGLAAEFLNPACGLVKPHARRSALMISRVATVIVGRAESLPAPAEAEPMRVTVAGVESPHALVGAGKTVIPTAQPVERQVPPKKPKVGLSALIVSAPVTHEPNQQDVGSIAFAAMPRLRRAYNDRPGDNLRATAMPPISGGPFGGIW